jgi:hypothetical protein
VYETRHAPLATPAQFRARFGRAALASLTMIGTTLALGMAGYHWIADLAWIDAFHQASMLLSGMGPVVEPNTL